MARHTSESTPQSKGKELREIGKHLAEHPVMLESTKRTKELFMSIDKLPQRKGKTSK